jgi:hypothetical protein
MERIENSPDIREQLLRNNPFFSGSASDPWSNADPDVLSLNREAYENICALIRQKNREPDSGLGGLVLGESGMGKTHFLKRLLDYTRQNDISAFFVSVKPLLNPKRPLRHLLREIAVNLRRLRSSGKSGGASQFESLVSRIMLRYRQEESQNFSFSQFSTHFNRHCPGIDPSVLRAVFGCRDPDSEMQPMILDWLEGCVDEEHVSALRVQDREKMDDTDLEDEARGILSSLGMLLKYCGMSTVLCFDQLDSMKEDALIRAFGDIVYLLVGQVPGMLPLVFVRDTMWSERFLPRTDPAVAGRLLLNREVLETCSLAQAEELIKLRIESRFRADASEKYRWLMQELRGKLKEGTVPRNIIILANEAILHPGGEPGSSDIPAVLADEYRRAREKVAADFDLWPPDAERLRKALQPYLESRPEYGEIRPGGDKYVTFTGKYREPNGAQTDFAFILNTAGHYKTVEAAFRRGADFLRRHPGGRCYYISDGRCPFRAGWRQARAVRNDFESLGGTTLFLKDAQVFDWYGLTAMIFKLEANDIVLPVSTGFRPATAEDFALYMKEGFKKGLFSEGSLPSASLSVLPPAPPSPPTENPPGAIPPVADDETLAEKSAAILRGSAMQFMALDLLCGRLGRDGLNVARDVLLCCLGKRDDIFCLCDSTDDKLVMLK